jgi:hypothetical protein
LKELADAGLTADAMESKRLFTTHDGATAMLKTSRLLQSQFYQHCCSHALHLLIMKDGITKVPSLKTLITHCKDVVTKLHFKGDMVEDELMKTYSAEVVKALILSLAN